MSAEVFLNILSDAVKSPKDLSDPMVFVMICVLKQLGSQRSIFLMITVHRYKILLYCSATKALLQLNVSILRGEEKQRLKRLIHLTMQLVLYSCKTVFAQSGIFFGIYFASDKKKHPETACPVPFRDVLYGRGRRT